MVSFCTFNVLKNLKLWFIFPSKNIAPMEGSLVGDFYEVSFPAGQLLRCSFDGVIFLLDEG
jgi:hypothetical protein